MTAYADAIAKPPGTLTEQWTWSRTSIDRGFTVTSTTPEGRISERTVSRAADGSMWVGKKAPAGLNEKTSSELAGPESYVAPDGTTVTTTDATNIPLDVSVTRTDTAVVTLPSGLTSALETTQDRVVDAVGDPLCVKRTTETVHWLRRP